MTLDNLSDWLPLAGVVGGLAVWALTRLWELAQTSRARSHARDAFLRAIFAEIDFNTRDLERFFHSAQSEDHFRQRFRDDRFIPHVTDARHTIIYRNGLDQLHVMDNWLISEIVAFYGGLESIAAQIEGLEKPSLLTISLEGRVNTMMGLIAKSDDCAKSGRAILLRMEQKYAYLGLERAQRSQKIGQTLTERENALASGLDRVRAKDRHDADIGAENANFK